MDIFNDNLNRILTKHYPNNQQPEGPVDKAKEYNEKVDQFIIDHLQAMLPDTLENLADSNKTHCLDLIDIFRNPISYLTLALRNLTYLVEEQNTNQDNAKIFKSLVPYLKKISTANLKLVGKVESLVYELGSRLDNIYNHKEEIIKLAFPHLSNIAFVTAPILIQLCKPLHYLTPLHPIALKHAIYATLFRHSLSIADKNLGVEGDKLSPYVRTHEFLTFYYYAGIVHINLSQFDEAVACFEMLLVVPPQTIPQFPEPQVSIVQIQGYKKYRLCQLATTSDTRLPEQIDKIVKQVITKSTAEYDNLLKKLDVEDPLSYKTQIKHLLKDLQADGNLTTAQLALLKCKELALTEIHRTYYRLTLEELSLRNPSPTPTNALFPLLHLAGLGKLNFSLHTYTTDQNGALKEGNFQFTKLDSNSHKACFNQLLDTVKTSKRHRTQLELQELAGIESYGKKVKKALLSQPKKG